jgi:hypothetical protein
MIRVKDRYYTEAGKDIGLELCGTVYELLLSGSSIGGEFEVSGLKFHVIPQAKSSQLQTLNFKHVF